MKDKVRSVNHWPKDVAKCRELARTDIEFCQVMEESFGPDIGLGSIKKHAVIAWHRSRPILRSTLPIEAWLAFKSEWGHLGIESILELAQIAVPFRDLTRSNEAKYRAVAFLLEMLPPEETQVTFNDRDWVNRRKDSLLPSDLDTQEFRLDPTWVSPTGDAAHR